MLKESHPKEVANLISIRIKEARDNQEEIAKWIAGNPSRTLADFLHQYRNSNSKRN